MSVSPPALMSLQEIQETDLNPDVAREAYDQVAQRLGDILDAKATFEQKALALFGGYITIALALFGFAAAGLGEAVTAPQPHALFIVGAIFAAGAGVFVLALWDANYGARASNPDMWLRPEILGDQSALAVPRMLAYIVRHHHERIGTSIASNQFKLWCLRVGMTLGVVAPFVLLALIVLGPR